MFCSACPIGGKSDMSAKSSIYNYCYSFSIYHYEPVKNPTDYILSYSEQHLDLLSVVPDDPDIGLAVSKEKSFTL